MKRYILRRWVWAAVAGVLFGVGSAAAQAPAPIVTRNAALRLPVQLDERSRAEVTQVKLYVRGPDGQWVCVQTGPPTQTAFDFRAPADGEYWFTFVTVDRRGNINPPSVEAVPPHRVVVVDRAGRGATAGRPTRETLPPDIAPPSMPPRPPVERGKPDPTLYAKDEVLPPAPPVADTNVRGVGHTDLPTAPRGDLPAVPALPDIKAPEGAADIKVPGVPDVPPPAPRPAAPDRTEDLKIPELPADPPASPKPVVDVPPPPTMRTTSALKPSDSLPPLAAAPKPEKEPASKGPVGSRPILNTRTCTVNYQLDGPTRFPNRIDYWATADGGRTWTQVRDLNGGIPPAKLVLPGDGVFGIRIRPGGGTKPPEPLEDPDCVVEVDTTTPVVSLAAPVLAEEGVVILGWTASDENLVSNSISLYYAPKPAGPWEVIVSGYKNTGEYKWALPPGLTGPVYLRVEAADRAGNIGRHESPSAVSLEAGKQRVKVLGVGPGQ